MKFWPESPLIYLKFVVIQSPFDPPHILVERFDAFSVLEAMIEVAVVVAKSKGDGAWAIEDFAKCWPFLDACLKQLGLKWLLSTKLLVIDISNQNDQCAC